MLTVVRPCLVVAVLQLKGGTGKTTIATNVAAAAFLAGLRTLLLDCDSGQHSAMEWAASRDPDSPLLALAVKRAARPQSPKLLRDATAGFDVAFLDGPPQLGDITRAAAEMADVAVLPVTPGAPDFYALTDTLASLKESDARREDVGLPPIRRAIVLNQAAPIRASVLADEVLRREHPEHYVGKIRRRVHYYDAHELGASVHGIAGAEHAVADIERLWRIIRKGTHADHRRKAHPEGSRSAAGR